ncbi:MAG: 1-acyl-sn-glycerol-3-phosphate acyltransferase, partial [Pseudoalteromonas tetraodonis]
MPKKSISPEPRTGFRVWVDCVLLYLIVSAFGVGGMLTALLATLIHLVLPRNRGKRLGRWLNLGLFRLFAWVIRAAHLVYPELEALDTLREEKGIIIAPNHITSLDALFVISRLPN